MKRFYYTDPLAAAWMAKHYNMQFADMLGSRLAFVTTSRGCHFVSLEFDDNEEVQAELYDGKYYVHPDSLPLLGHKIGDTVHKDKSFFLIVDFEYGKDGKHSIGGGQKTIRGIYREKDPSKYIIIHRNNTPFINPESEEV